MSDPDAPEPDLPRGVALAWGIAADPQRGPKREMSVEKIVEAAVEIADAEGLGGVSMAAVAARMGFTPMSLYRYVSAKDDLMLLMHEEASGVPPESVRAANGWRARLEAVFRAQVDVFLRHPWVLEIPLTGSPTTPNGSAWMDVSLESLEGTPLTQDERIAVTLLVTGQSRWYGTILAAYAHTARASGLSPEALSAHESRLYDRLISADEFPALRRAVDAGVFVSEADPFLFGIDRILDGVGSYIERVQADPARAEPAEWMRLDDSEASVDKRYREAQKAVRTAEKALRDARRAERQALREARERLSRGRGSS